MQPLNVHQREFEKMLENARLRGFRFALVACLLLLSLLPLMTASEHKLGKFQYKKPFFKIPQIAMPTSDHFTAKRAQTWFSTVGWPFATPETLPGTLVSDAIDLRAIYDAKNIPMVRLEPIHVDEFAITDAANFSFE